MMYSSATSLFQAMDPSSSPPSSSSSTSSAYFLPVPTACKPVSHTAASSFIGDKDSVIAGVCLPGAQARFPDTEEEVDEGPAPHHATAVGTFADVYASHRVAFHLDNPNISTPSLTHSSSSSGSDDDDASSSASSSSLADAESTNATASDLPGAGRVLGNLYSRGGRPLERALGRLAAYTGLAPFISARAGGGASASEGEGTSSRSINFTMSDLPGPGRVLGNLYSRGGRRLEKGVARLAKKWPSDLDYQISSVVVYSRNKYAGTGADLSERERKSVRKMCRKMLNYTHSSMVPTQTEALTGIVDLCVWSPAVREAFQQSDADITLSTVARRRDIGFDDGSEESTRRLFLHSRRALLASQDNDVHKLGAVLVPQLADNWRDVQWCKVDNRKWGVESVHPVKGASGPASPGWKIAFMRMLTYLRDPELAFLALRYFDLWSFFVHESAVEYDTGLALQLCASLLAILSSAPLFGTVETKPLEYTTRRLHDKLSALSFLHQLPSTEPINEVIKYGGCDIHIPSVIRMLNSLRDGLGTRNLSIYYTRANLKYLPEIRTVKAF